MPKGDLLLLRGGIAPVRAGKIEYFRSHRFTSRICEAPKVGARSVAVQRNAPGAPAADAASGSDVLFQAIQAKRAALLDVAPAEERPPVTRPLTDEELSGFAEITDDMLVLGELADLPPPGDEKAALDFVMAMTARAVVDAEDDLGPAAAMLTEGHDHGR